MKAVISPKELAYAIGVSESSLKRWTDEGLIKASRTAGGHRRIAVPDAIRFIRNTRTLLVHPEVLGLSDVETALADESAAETDTDRLFAYLRDGKAPEARGLIMSRYLAGDSLAEIFDGPVRDVMHRLGKLWRHDETGIMLEHRATDICIQAVQQLRATLQVPRGAPVAVGGAPPKDPYLLPSLLAAACLAGEGYHAVNLGPETPLESLRQAAEETNARLVWLSISVNARPDQLRIEIAALAEALRERGARLMIGGEKSAGVKLPAAYENTLFGRSMAELVAFGRGLLAAPTGQAGTTPG
jgi:methanogenic corrinoid protein MtbC1